VQARLAELVDIEVGVASLLIATDEAVDTIVALVLLGAYEG
jgi:hypothetical protein